MRRHLLHGYSSGNLRSNIRWLGVTPGTCPVSHRNGLPLCASWRGGGPGATGARRSTPAIAAVNNRSVPAREARKQSGAEQAGGDLEQRLKAASLRGTRPIATQDVPTVSRIYNSWANRLGIPVAEFQLAARPVSVLSSQSFGVYKIDGLTGEASPQ